MAIEIFVISTPLEVHFSTIGCPLHGCEHKISFVGFQQMEWEILNFNFLQETEIRKLVVKNHLY